MTATFDVFLVQRKWKVHKWGKEATVQKPIMEKVKYEDTMDH